MGFRWPTMPGSGRAQVAQQIGAIGAGIGRLGEVFEEKQARVRLDDFKLGVTKRMIELGNEIDREQDEDKYLAMMDAAFSDLQGQIPKGMAGPLATSYLKSEKAAQLQSVDVSMELRVESRWRANNLIHQQTAIQTLNPIPLSDSLDIGLANGHITEFEAEKIRQSIGPKIKEARRRVVLDDLAEKAMAQADSPLSSPEKARAWLRKQKGLSNAERNEVEARLDGMIAERVETEEKRVTEARTDLGVRMYADTKKTTIDEVNDANLPEEIAKPLRKDIRLRDKEIAEKKKVVTSVLTRTKINLIKASVTVGELTAIQGVDQFLKFTEDVKIEERGVVIDSFFKAEKDSEDDTKRQNQTILTERGNKLRDAIERSQGIIQLVKDEEREFLIDLANDAVIELNDRFRGLDFTTNDIDAFNDSLMRKYVLSQQAVSRAVAMKSVIAKKTFAKQVDAMVARIKSLKGNPFEQGLALDEGMRLGLVNEDGTPSTEAREAIEKDDIQFLDALLKRR